MSSHNRRRAVRARMDKTGESYTTALRAMTDHGAEPAEVVPAVDWSPLYGVEITITPPPRREIGTPQPRSDRSWRAVVLPPAPDTPSGRLRVSVTHRPEVPPTPGAVVTFDPSECVIDPMPDRVHERFLPSRRLTTGPKGLPLYRSDNLPTLALASRSTLRRQLRREPGPDQRPVAEYYQLRDYSDLWAIADAVAMAPLSSARQAKWDKIRTCARCGSTHLDPLPESRYGPRYCTPCREPAAKEFWDADRAIEREQSIAWAASVLADPTSVWIFRDNGTIATLFIGRISDGTVLVDLPKVYWGAEEYRRWHKPQDLRGCVERTDAEQALLRVVGSRFIGWDRMAEMPLITANRGRPPGHAGVELPYSDTLEERYARWLGVPSYESYAHQPPAVIGGLVPDTVREQFAEAVAVLREMAAGEPSEDRKTAARTAWQQRKSREFSTLRRPGEAD